MNWFGKAFEQLIWLSVAIVLFIAIPYYGFKFFESHGWESNFYFPYIVWCAICAVGIGQVYTHYKKED